MCSVQDVDMPIVCTEKQSPGSRFSDLYKQHGAAYFIERLYLLLLILNWIAFHNCMTVF